ncbi:MAG: type I glutamate--ammonia ligase [Chloroflexi bacterium]|nr:type I glutamate--ammonia ligase [Chloroflexota bacterium]
MTLSDQDEDIRADVLARGERDQVKFVSLHFTDIVGAAKSVTIPFHKLKDAEDHGVWFDGSAIEGFARIHESDMYLDPDLRTFSIIPWEGKENTTARVVCNVFTPDGEEFAGDPRHVLRRAMAEANRLGFVFQTSPELEFFLVRADHESVGSGVFGPDRAGYFDATQDELANLRKEIVTDLEEMGIMVDASHHEVAYGQHEIDLRYADALRTADNTMAAKTAVKALAQRHGLTATFMPKPFLGMSGSGMHIHQSLAGLQDGTNLFYDTDDEYEISQVARHFAAGQLAHAPGMCAILAPLVNSYKRLVPGFEAPGYISWARINRSALLRVPRVNRRRPESARIELRCPDPSCNPYLAFAVMLAAGLDGIHHQMPLPNAVEEDLFQLDDPALAGRGLGPLPTSLEQALQELERDQVILDALGEHVAEWFIEAKRREWAEYRTQISQWEWERYLESC